MHELSTNTINFMMKIWMNIKERQWNLIYHLDSTDDMLVLTVEVPKLVHPSRDQLQLACMTSALWIQWQTKTAPPAQIS